MLNIIILLICVVTMVLMTSDPRASEQESVQSAWQQNTSHTETQDSTSKLKSKPTNNTEQI
ncbi:ABZJ_00068 family colistin stress protein [Acinetobacter terrestris]|uniref:ABZJ_00068 family colistin stress protein n=1 Tax=Acinetobacter terrestris TaxID=2529843 RepID=UPI003F9E558E